MVLIVTDTASDDASSGNRDSVGNAQPVSSVESSNYKWQREMDLQFESLVESIRPLIVDADLSARMFRLIRKNRGITATLDNTAHFAEV